MAAPGNMIGGLGPVRHLHLHRRSGRGGRASVLAAADTATRARRLATLGAVADVAVVPVDERVALAWARLRVQLAESGRRVNLK